MTLQDGLLLALFSGVSSVVGAYFGGYIRRKGENLATSEDLGHLTRVVESIKQENAMFVEDFRASQSHRFLAASDRLAAHQDAFVQWHAVFASIRTDDFERATGAARDWWTSHCLYLDDPARRAFRQGLSAILSWWGLNKPHSLRPEHIAESDRLWKEFFAVPEAIFRAAGVPPLAQGELVRPAGLTINQ